MPFHAYGPDKGSRACPVCKYGRYHGIIYFVGNHPDWADIKKWLAFLEQESVSRGNHLKAYFVYGNENGYSKDKRQDELERLGRELNLQKVAVTFVPSLSDTESEINLSRVDPSVGNTIVVYRNRTIVDTFVNLKAIDASFQLVSSTIERTKRD
jgi:protocatechuate 3,4-dioxygenase beta subunit